MLIVVYKLLRFYLTCSRPLIVFAVLAALFAGVTSVVLIILINVALAGIGTTDVTQKWAFAGLVVVQLAVMSSSGFLATHLAERTAFDLRLRLCREIFELPLQGFEKIGGSSLLAVLTQDILNISNACVQIPQLMISLCVLAFSVIYLATLSSSMFLYLVLGLVLAIASIRLMEARAFKSLAKSREVWDSLMGDFSSVTEGYKNLKLNRERRLVFLQDVLSPTAGSLRDHNIRAGSIYAVVASWAMVLYFILIGFLLYGSSWLGADSNPANLISYAFTVLFMRSYIVALMLLLPLYAQAGTSLRKLEGLDLVLARSFPSLPQGSPAQNNVKPSRFQELELREVTHRYWSEDEEDSFCLGPINLKLRPGEVVFILGNNGSGKTTLIKILTGLYPPESGEVRVDGEALSSADYEGRQLFAAAFTDSHVIRKLLDAECGADDAAFRTLLQKMKLAHKVRTDKGALSNINLSFGQSRRLALLIALHEDRPLYVFDEWDSGQDPSFKKVFFSEIIPDLQARGKTVVVATHEDRYLHVADRVITLDFGKIESDLPVAKFAAETA